MKRSRQTATQLIAKRRKAHPQRELRTPEELVDLNTDLHIQIGHLRQLVQRLRAEITRLHRDLERATARKTLPPRSCLSTPPEP